MKVEVTCVSSIVQERYADRFDPVSGLVILHPQTLQAQQDRLPNRHIVELEGSGAIVRLDTVAPHDAEMETAFEIGKTYTVEIDQKEK